MTPTEKAKELLDKMSSQTYYFQEYAGAHYSKEEIGWEGGKKCALIAVDEILESINTLEYYPEYFREYWNDVIIELEKL